MRANGDWKWKWKWNGVCGPWTNYTVHDTAETLKPILNAPNVHKKGDEWYKNLILNELLAIGARRTKKNETGRKASAVE